MKYRYDIYTGVKKIKTKAFVAVATLGIIVGGGGLSLAVLGSSQALTPTVVYNNIPSPQPGNVVSVSFEATGTSEFGGQVAFTGTARQNPTVTVLMSSWGCETGHWTTDNCLTTPSATFSVPITLNVYNVGTGTTQGSPPGSLITSVTQAFNIPYRPSADHVNCGTTGEWYSTADRKCYNGFATPITFNLTGTLPDQAVISVAYNTTTYGYNPIGTSSCSSTAAGCGYDSLNVGVDSALTAGLQLRPNDAYQDTVYDSCTNGAISPFGLDLGCWTGYQPAFEVSASQALPTSKNQCMNGGWQNYGTTFKNQGDCVSFVATGGKSQGNSQ